MWELKAEEESGEAPTAHFQELNPDELTEEDRGIWEKLQNHALTHKEFNEYRTSVFRGSAQSCKHFAAFIGNKLMVQQFEVENGEK